MQRLLVNTLNRLDVRCLHFTISMQHIAHVEQRSISALDFSMQCVSHGEQHLYTSLAGLEECRKAVHAGKPFCHKQYINSKDVSSIHAMCNVVAAQAISKHISASLATSAWVSLGSWACIADITSNAKPTQPAMPNQLNQQCQTNSTSNAKPTHPGLIAFLTHASRAVQEHSVLSSQIIQPLLCICQPMLCI